MLLDKNMEEFLKSLTELSKKHNLWLDSCGCCDSISVGPASARNKGAYKFDEIDHGFISGLGVKT